MKHIRTIFLVLLAVLMAAGCSPKQTDTQDATAVPSSIEPAVETTDGWDFDNRFGMNYDKLVETEDAYYYSAYDSCWLYYYDKASGERGVLCPKPECMHDEGGDSSCNGYIVQICASLNYWDGRLHYYATDQTPYCAVFAMALDGSDRTKDLKINVPAVLPGITPQRLDYHRGKLYGYDLNEVVINSEPHKQIIVFSIDAETGKFREIYSALSTDGGLTEPYIVYKQNFVYISYDEYTVTEEYKLDTLTWHLIRWNIDTEQIEEIAAANAEVLNDTFLEHMIYIDDDSRVWFVPKSSNMESPMKIFLLENSKISVAFRFDTTGACFMVQDAVVNIFSPEKRWEVRRLDSSLIWEGELDTSFLDGLDEERNYTLGGVISCMGTAEEIFISFKLEGNDGAGRICLVRYDMTGEKPVPTVIANARCTSSPK